MRPNSWIYCYPNCHYPHCFWPIMLCPTRIRSLATSLG
jgi:hypothetical protein